MNIFTILLSSTACALIAVSLSILLAYLFTGQQIGKPIERHALDFLLLASGFTAQYLFRDDSLASNVLPNTLTLTFFIIAVLEKRGKCNGMLIGDLPKETGILAGCKGVVIMLINGLAIVVLCLILSIAFQCLICHPSLP